MLPHSSGKGEVKAGCGKPAPGTGWLASQADTALISSIDKRDAMVAMQSGAAACRAPFFQAPNCALR
jgi:ABC-type arginine transport system permease subunit